MKRNRKVKILATLGPSSSDAETIRKLHEAGADIFRVNMSHTSHDKLNEFVKTIRGVEADAGRPICILADLQGPKLRVGTFSGGPQILEAGQEFRFVADKIDGNKSEVYLPHPEILAALKAGDTVLIDDGKVRLRTISCDGHTAVMKVEVPGRISDRKGVSLPDTTIATSALTDKDRADLDAALAAGVDWVALSFVQRPEDLDEPMQIIGNRAAVMVKVEKPQAIQHLEEITRRSDGLMVARGDLGVEMPLEQVPGLQKRMTRLGRRYGKPVVIATQMLESMISSPVPTRAEVSDVATGVFEGADAVMLSAESASGAYPVEAVATMDRIAYEVERDRNYLNIVNAQRAEPEATGADVISQAARTIAETMNLAAIVCFTSSGATGMRLARERPWTRIIALSPRQDTARRLQMAWGLHTVVCEDAEMLADLVQIAARVAGDEALPTPASGSSSPPACRCAPPARPTCCASPPSTTTAAAASDPAAFAGTIRTGAGHAGSRFRWPSVFVGMPIARRREDRRSHPRRPRSRRRSPPSPGRHGHGAACGRRHGSSPAGRRGCRARGRRHGSPGRRPNRCRR
ncbi:Pyruvate kinase [Methylobrevis pamukkalensis]|uniref:Pyruvate kinase n=1 Tax=Methylobrevis pamukkalensis TaxID=1439726 RepID=A0A1E3GYH9_9HYPH|nr:Pyruvate kinase [Methylobrevis pamukkalensis]